MAKTFFAKDQKYGDWTLKLPFAGGGNSFVWEAENSKGERKIIKLLKKDGDLARTRFVVRLECEEIKPLKGSSRESSQQVTEKGPGVYGPYGGKENYYDEHRHYLEGWRNVTRYFKGSFVIFQKTSTYNYTSQTYDGRHNTVSASAFRDYIQRVADSDYKIYKVVEGDKPGLYVRGKMLDL